MSERPTGVDGTSTAASKGLHELPHHRAREMRENQKRVQRMRVEKKYMQEVSGGKGYKLGDYQRLQEQELLKMSEKQTFVPPPRVAKKKVEKEFLPVKVVHEFSGSIRCLELTQGGATIWTGDYDGTISIRVGMTGQIAHHIPATGGLYVDSLYATDTHMWVGMHDGTVRIYDHLVYILVSEATFHKGSVTCFASTFDGKVFSASADASIVKWDTEANNFALMSKICGSSSEMIRCLACYGYNLFTGGDDSIIRCMDTEAGSGQDVREFVGHTDSVNSLLVQDGYLFSGSKDMTIRAWNMEDGKCIWVLGSAVEPDSRVWAHNAAITAFIGDPVSHRFWSADAAGVIHVWESTPENDFEHIMELKNHEGPPIISLKAFCTIDAVKLWSLAANGKNRVWYSAVNKMEDAVQSTIDAMESIINQDLIELAKWKELIKKLEQTDERRKNELSNALASTCEWHLLRGHLLRWHRWLALNRQKKRRENIANMLEMSDTKATLFVFFQKLERYYIHKKLIRKKQAMSRGLRAQTERSLQLAYWRKMKGYAMVLKRKNQLGHMAGVLEAHAYDNLYRLTWRKWRKYVDEQNGRRKRSLLAQNLARLSDKAVTMEYYFKLRGYRLHKLRQVRKEKAVEVLGNLAHLRLRNVYYRKLAHYARDQVLKRRRLVFSAIFGHKEDERITSQYYAKWYGYYNRKQKESLLDKIEAEKERNAELTETYEAKKAVLERLKTLDDKRKEIQKAQEAKAAAEARRATAEEELARLEQLLQEKQAGLDDASRREKTRKEQVEDVMAMLKAKCLNYHLDYTLIQKIRQEASRCPVTKIFQEAHMGVKRVVIDVTKFDQEFGARWKGMESRMDQIPDHHKSTILHNVKTMIICYDLMSDETLEELETDDEILNNTDYLEQMVTLSVRYRDAKLGRAAHRVK